MLKFELNVEERKTLAKRMEELTGIHPYYTKAPRYAYDIGNYTIDRDGNLLVEAENADLELLTTLMNEGLIRGGEDVDAETLQETADEQPAVDLAEGVQMIPAVHAHRVAVLEEGMAYKPISLPPEDSQFLETKQFSVTEICRIFRVPPHLVADLSRATFSNIEYQSLNFVMHSLTPWLVRIEQGIIKDLLLEEEQDTYFPKFNVDGLLRGDYQSRMNGYATGISNGFLSPNDVHRLENMDLIPAEEGGDGYYLNGGYVKLKDAGVAQQNKAASVQQNQPKQTQSEEQDPEEEPDSDNRLSESKPRKNGRRNR